jgi:hypothetical protein
MSYQMMLTKMNNRWLFRVSAMAFDSLNLQWHCGCRPVGGMWLLFRLLGRIQVNLHLNSSISFYAAALMRIFLARPL